MKLSAIRDQLKGLKKQLNTYESDLNTRLIEMSQTAEKWYVVDQKIEQILKFNENKTITLNIGGQVYQSKLETLLSIKDTLFYKLIYLDKVDLSREIFVDRNPEYFKYILSYLRNKKLDKSKLTVKLYENIREEAEFYQFEEILDLLSVKYIQLDNAVSRYSGGNQYYCNVTAYEIVDTKDDEFRIYIDMFSDNSLGQIQDPKVSKLTNTLNNQNIRILNAVWEIADPNSRYKGYLIFKLSEMKVGQYTFTFGNSGYNPVHIFNYDG